MLHDHLSDPPQLQALVRSVVDKAKKFCNNNAEPSVVVAPYRFNPLGAHIDHQGGDVLARTIDQYTVMAFYPASDGQYNIACEFQNGETNQCRFDLDAPLTSNESNWQRYAMASAQCMRSGFAIDTAIQGYVQGTLVGAGLSSSASVILAYVTAMAQANGVALSQTQLVDLVSQVENHYMGLNNGIQDQMSVVFGQSDGLSLLDVSQCMSSTVHNHASIDEVQWVLFYSGFSRELVGSGFNDRVRECREAAALLDKNAEYLGQVPEHKRSEVQLNKLPPHLKKRAQHVYGEMARVAAGVSLWESGDYIHFGNLMNTSCQSSIALYECGSEPMIALQQLALNEPCVLGSRFSGGGYGGCLNMLVNKSASEGLEDRLLQAFEKQYPEKKGIAKVFKVESEQGVRVLQYE